MLELYSKAADLILNGHWQIMASTMDIRFTSFMDSREEAAQAACGILKSKTTLLNHLLWTPCLPAAGTIPTGPFSLLRDGDRHLKHTTHNLARGKMGGAVVTRRSSSPLNSKKEIGFALCAITTISGARTIVIIEIASCQGLTFAV